MRSKAWLIALPLLMGCEKRQTAFIVNMMNPTHAQYKDASKYFFIGAGQSNMSHEILSNTFPDSVNVAVGGSTLWMWYKGQPFYTSVVTACRSQAKPCVLLFWQGEAEGADSQLNDWHGQFDGIVRSLRADTGQALPVMYVQIGQVDIGRPVPYWSAIQDQQAAMWRDLPDMRMISAADMFPDTGDGLHYGQDQYAVIQRRLYSAWEDS